ncbi:glutamate-1-semialdehyde 2,1-aminomutase [Paludicola sp. MB14-C6]|uniref:glutamate-1-semialdehyde 2,1-aminomutase n=1 Tax=Paludihabitans sp. MB14-C6 TaxID=3070656 RepID=UPI0027DDD512|nr:glutamate-1-semialdehyde 2,1-aminomutase [Paludicola sp. MB14-C6]WMJ22040.1 glutamate-1-semialdehyde 2,1-aminomutase [Paludicola sp. MB14-C6]
MTESELLFDRAKKVMPGGVNSPVRAFNAVGGAPRFIKSAKGARIYDADGREYLDYIGSWGPMILGHANEKVLDAVSKTMANGLSFGAATELEVIMGELITSIVKPIEMIRMVNSGTEAVMSAIRLARGYTQREKIIKFAGCYHGHSDAMLVKAGSGALTNSNPDSSGVTKGAAKDTLLAQYNDINSVAELFDSNKGEIAAVIVEPVAANMGVVPPQKGFLEGLRKLCDEQNALLIFDEVITGFRLALGGAMEYFNVNADLVTYGKIIGGGMPVGAYGGRREIMSHVSPTGSVYQAGTLSGNPVAMAAGLATLTELKNNPQVYTNINTMASRLADGIRKHTKYTVNNIGSLLCTFFTDQNVYNYETARTSDTKRYASYFNHMLDNGVYIAPAQFEAMFVSNVHTNEDIDKTIEIIKKFK